MWKFKVCMSVIELRSKMVKQNIWIFNNYCECILVVGELTDDWKER